MLNRRHFMDAQHYSVEDDIIQELMPSAQLAGYKKGGDNEWVTK